MIRILATENNARGDLFARLLRDFFFSLGYDECRFNIARSGRVVDVHATHRTERRVLVAEAKAQKKPIGGSDINKFVGVLDAEQRRSSVPVSGYYVSLSSYTETAREQEVDAGGDRVVLVDGSDL